MQKVVLSLLRCAQLYLQEQCHKITVIKVAKVKVIGEPSFIYLQYLIRQFLRVETWQK